MWGFREAGCGAPPPAVFVIASDQKSRGNPESQKTALDCFVAALLAMTNFEQLALLGLVLALDLPGCAGVTQQEQAATNPTEASIGAPGL
jgi:hypothetical protein